MVAAQPQGGAISARDRSLYCLGCRKVITGDGYSVPAVNPFETDDGATVTYRAFYHVGCLPARWAPQIAVLDGERAVAGG